MFKKLPFILLIILSSCQAQQKIRGSRNVKTEQTNLAPFESIEVSGEFKVGILKGKRPLMEVKADDNLHKLIQAEVVDGVLYIKPLKEFTRTKSQEIEITYTDELKNVKISDKVELESLQDLYLENFQLETKNDAKAYITLTANNFNLINGDDAKVELNVTASEVYYQLNQKSDVKALVNAPLFKVDILDKASARIDGDIEDFTLNADQNAKFDGENLTCIRAAVTSQGDSQNKINVTEQVELSAKGKSETEIFNNPEINLVEFSEEAKIAKKEFNKGLF